jgi:hypothetical protein
MKLNAATLCVCAALLSFPFPAYLPYWLFGLGVAGELVVAAKLSSVTTLLAAQVGRWGARRAWRGRGLGPEAFWGAPVGRGVKTRCPDKF